MGGIIGHPWLPKEPRDPFWDVERTNFFENGCRMDDIPTCFFINRMIRFGLQHGSSFGKKQQGRCKSGMHHESHFLIDMIAKCGMQNGSSFKKAGLFILGCSLDHIFKLFDCLNASIYPGMQNGPSFFKLG